MTALAPEITESASQTELCALCAEYGKSTPAVVLLLVGGCPCGDRQIGFCVPCWAYLLGLLETKVMACRWCHAPVNWTVL